VTYKILVYDKKTGTHLEYDEDWNTLDAAMLWAEYWVSDGYRVEIKKEPDAPKQPDP